MKKPYQSRGGGDRGGRSFGGGGSWNRGGFGDRGYSKPSLHSATCNKCGDRCEVPFKPNGKKPVFCSNCFVKDEDGGAKRSFGDRSYSRSREEKPAYAGRSSSQGEDYGAQLKAIHAKLDAIIEALES